MWLFTSSRARRRAEPRFRRRVGAGGNVADLFLLPCSAWIQNVMSSSKGGPPNKQQKQQHQQPECAARSTLHSVEDAGAGARPSASATTQVSHRNETSSGDNGFEPASPSTSPRAAAPEQLTRVKSASNWPAHTPQPHGSYRHRCRVECRHTGQYGVVYCRPKNWKPGTCTVPWVERGLRMKVMNRRRLTTTMFVKSGPFFLEIPWFSEFGR